MVGAGVAGMATAQMLRSLGLSVIVLEARNRIGGRCFCDNSFPAPFDFGGQFFHQVVSSPVGGTFNPLFDLYRSQGGPDLPVVLAPSFCKNGAILPPADQEPFQEMVAAVMASIAAAGEAAELGAPDMTAAEVTTELVGLPWYNATIAFGELTLDAPPERLSCLDAWNDIKYSLNFDGSPSDRANPGGMGNWVAQFKDGLDIKLSTPVLEIDTTEAARIKVTTAGGVITSKTIVVTAPMTVLAAEQIRFKPGLPPAYSQAFHDLPFGLVDKIGLSFNAPVFNSMPDNIVVTRHEDTSEFSMAVAKMAGKPNMMNLFAGGDQARGLEAGGMPAFRAFAEEFLAETFDASVVAALDRVLVHPWGQDPLTMGSYSAALPGKASARTTLATPIDNRIYFAGEAISVTAHSSLHGAYLTGRTAATQIAAHLKA